MTPFVIENRYLINLDKIAMILPDAILGNYTIYFDSGDTFTISQEHMDRLIKLVLKRRKNNHV